MAEQQVLTWSDVVKAMKRGLLLFLLAAAVLTVGLIASYQHATAMSNGAPDLNCVKCHLNADKNPADFVVEGLPEKYEPGKTYKITIKITKGPSCSAGAACGGFAVAVSAGELVVTDKKNTFISELPTGEKVLTHTKDGSKLREWAFEWKAPSQPTPVKFTIAVIAANGDGSFTGDAYASKTITLQAAAAKPTPTPTVTTTTKLVTEVTTTVVTTSTPKEKTEHNPVLAAIVAIVIFVVVVGAYLAATRK